MSKIEKKLNKWRNPAFKQEVNKDEIDSILNHYFPGQWSFGDTRGSHNYKISHLILKGNQNYGPDGDYMIPVKGGQKIKHFYLKELIQIIDMIEEEKSEEKS